LSFGDLEAVLLFGLRNDGLTLLSNYVDRTSDVQTAALAYSFVSPGLIRNDLRVIRWIETYRSQLDELQLWTDRAKFDTARGVRARAAMEQSRLAGKPAEANEVAGMLRKIAPAQIVVRCGFCATNVGPQSAGGRAMNEFARGGMSNGVAGKVRLKSLHLLSLAPLLIRRSWYRFYRVLCALHVASNFQHVVSA